MADVVARKSIPCRFDEAWQGKCKKPSTNGWCSKHERTRCVSCGKKAVKSCDHGSSITCGAYLCETCSHAFRGDGHVTKEVYDQAYQAWRAEEDAKKKSRTSPVARKDPKTALPLNLFELLKTDWRNEGFVIDHVYYLQIEHGLMGFFPAIYGEKREMIITTDEELLVDIWKKLPPKLSKKSSGLAYINREKSIMYAHADDVDLQDDKTPQPLMDRKTFDELYKKDPESFDWAPGLIGASVSESEFASLIERATRKAA